MCIPFDAKIKTAWIPRILKDEHKPWAFTPFMYFKKFGKKHEILNMTFTTAESFTALNQLPLFYQQVITSFNKSKKPVYPHTGTEVLDMQIWGNVF